MTPRATDEQVTRVAGESRVLRALKVMQDGFAAAWPESLVCRLTTLFASSDPSVANRVRARALLVLVAAVSAAIFSIVGTRRDGLTWMVPVVFAVAAVVVLAAVPPVKDATQRE